MERLHQLLDMPYFVIFLFIIFSAVCITSMLYFHVTSVILWILTGALTAYTVVLSLYWLYWYIKSDRIREDLELLDILRSKSYSLALSMELNLVFSVYYIYTFIRYHSPWFGNVALFYSSLTTARFVLLREFDLNHPSLRNQYKTYVMMGYIMLGMMTALLLMTIMAVKWNYVVDYPGITLYIMTIISLYLIINATRGYFRHRHFRSPLLSACQLISIAGALLGILSIQTVWLPFFSHDPVDVQDMNIVTGVAIFAVMITMSLYMIIHGNNVLKYGLDEEGNRIDTTMTDEDEIKELEQ